MNEEQENLQLAMINELNYLYTEGFINITYDDNYPNDITQAIISLKTPDELANDLANVS